MSINAGTIAAYLTLDTNKFTSAMTSARAQLKTLKDEGASFSDKMTAIGGACTTVGTSLTKNLTVPLLSLGISAGTFAVKYEDAFAGVRKTVDATEEEYQQLSDSIMRMASEMPTAAEEIAAVMEAAGQLGIQKENLESFTEVMVQLGDTTNLSADEAATTLARFANITGMSQEEFDRLGSTIVDLGNNFATTEAEISDMALRIAGAGKQVGMSEADIMGIAAALSSVGLEAEAGGSAISKVLVDMALAVEGGSEDSSESLKNFAKVAGMTSDEFAAAFEEDAAGALSAFVTGLGSLEENGGSAIAVLDEMGITEVRMRDALLRSGGAADTFTSALQTASTAWEENTALTTEAEKRYETTASQIKILWNQIKALGVQFGEILIPYLKKGISSVSKLVNWFSSLSDGTKKIIVTTALIAASIGPGVTAFGRLTSAVGSTVKVLTKVAPAMQEFIVVCSTNPYIALATAVVGVGVAVGSYISYVKKAKEGTEAFDTAMTKVMDAAAEFSSGISTADSILDGLDENLYSFDSTSKIQEEIESVQSKITAITKLASDERRALTQDEIDLLEDYYAELNSLTDKQYSVYESKLGVLSTLIEEETSMTTERAQSYLKDAQTLRDESKALAEESYAETLALLKQQYATEEEWNSTACQSQIQTAKDLRDKRIQIADEQYGGVTTAIANVYSEQNLGSVVDKINKFYTQLDDAEASRLAQLEANSKELDNMIFGMFGENLGVKIERQFRKWDINASMDDLVDCIKSDFSKGFTDIELMQIGSFLNMVANADIYGDELSTETQETLTGILSIFQYLSSDAKESMKNTWLGMKEELENAEPELYAAAEADANSIINAIDTALGIASPSRVMRERGRYTIQGFEEGMIDEKGNLLSDLGGIMDDIKEKAETLNLEDTGSDIMLGLQNGMNKKKSSLLATAGSIANSISSKIRSALDIHSPSRVMAAIGSQISAGLAVGMDEYSYVVENAASDLASITVSTVGASTSRNNIAVTPQSNNTKIDRVINLLELLLAKDGDIVLDGRVFGRWVKETLA